MADETKPPEKPAAASPPGTPTGAAPRPAATPPPTSTPPAQAAKIDGREVTQSGDRGVTPPDGTPRTAKAPPPAPEHKSEVGKPVTLADMMKTNLDPEGRVKQQDAAGNVIADENKIRRETPRPEAPNVQTDSRTNFNRQKIAELERQAIDAENLQGTRRLQARAAIRAQIRELRERENRTIGGADVRAPRGSILHAEEAIAENPDYHYRFVNISAPGKAENAKAMGYEKVPESEGGKTLGDLALFRTSLDRRAQIVGARDVETKRKIDSVADDLKGEVKEMAKFLRHRGVDIDERRLGVFGEND